MIMGEFYSLISLLTLRKTEPFTPFTQPLYSSMMDVGHLCIERGIKECQNREDLEIWRWTLE